MYKYIIIYYYKKAKLFAEVNVLNVLLKNILLLLLNNIIIIKKIQCNNYMEKK